MNTMTSNSQPATPVPGGPESAARRRALCVDDDPTCLRLLQATMQRVGFVVETARNGLEALTVYTCAPVEVVVTDHEMPLKNGLQFVRELRGTGFAGRIVVVSASVTPAIAREYLALGVAAILPKPFAIRELAAAVCG